MLNVPNIGKSGVCLEIRCQDETAMVEFGLELSLNITLDIYGLTCPGLRERRRIYFAGASHLETNSNH